MKILTHNSWVVDDVIDSKEKMNQNESFLDLTHREKVVSPILKSSPKFNGSDRRSLVYFKWYLGTPI